MHDVKTLPDLVWASLAPRRFVADIISFFAMIARFAVVVALGAAAALSGVFAVEPLLFWIGAAYVALLPLEVRLAL